MVLLQMNESFFVFFKHRCSIQVWMRQDGDVCIFATIVAEDFKSCGSVG